MNYSETANQLPKKLLSQFPQEIQTLSSGVPFLDLRAPGEFAKGQIPNSQNLPILNDLERDAVGKMYKENGQQRAIDLGHQLVSGDRKKQRVESWKIFLKHQPSAYLICWRGGLRSKIAQEWLKESGINIPKIGGGFKSLRQCLTMITDSIPEQQKPIWLIGGQTGSKKTVVIRNLHNSIDLEQLAKHRGSAFGGRIDQQPTPVTFENELALEILRHDKECLVLEDESRTIGRLAIPESLFNKMKRAPIALIEVSLSERVEHIHEEYIAQPISSGVSTKQLSDHYLSALNRIKKRLGGSRHAQLDKEISSAFEGSRSHHSWIEKLLTQYYDPMYQYQLSKKETRVEFRGSPMAVTEYLRHKT